MSHVFKRGSWLSIVALLALVLGTSTVSAANDHASSRVPTAHGAKGAGAMGSARTNTHEGALARTTTTVTSAGAGHSIITGTVPPWARASSLAGAASAGSQIGFRVYLGWHDQGALASFIRSVSDPRSTTYGQFLSPAQFRARYAPSRADANAVASWLTSQGFQLVYIPDNNHFVSVKGTVGQASKAFGVQFGVYRVGGMTLRSPSSNISVPSSIAPLISGEIGLDQSAALVRTNHVSADPNAGPTAAFVNAPPCSAYWAEKTDATDPSPAVTSPAGYADPLPWAPCGYTPQQIKGAYVGSTTLDGTGQTIGVIDAYASPTILQDANQWSANRGLPRFGTPGGGSLTQIAAPGVYNIPESPAQDPQGWYGEETLDVEAEHGMAPNAHIVYVGSANNYQDLDAAMNHFVDLHLGQIVSNSYGFRSEQLPPGFIIPFEQTLMQGAAEGIGIYFSSGDDNDETKVIGYSSVDWPASSPWVTAVGGTSLAVGASNNYLFETGWGTTRNRWNTSCSTTTPKTNTWCPPPPDGTWLYGSGGGVSCVFPRPAYQSALTATAGSKTLCSGFAGRAVPDIAAFGDPNTGYLIGQTQSFPNHTTSYSEYRIGGTSLSSPIFAGLMALADQKLGHPHGFANYAIYQNGASFRDVTDPASTIAVLRNDYCNSVDATQNCSAAATFGIITSLRTMNQTLTLHTAPGWDDVTGFGTPTAALLNLP
jgi:subtilase family serine protease